MVVSTQNMANGIFGALPVLLKASDSRAVDDILNHAYDIKDSVVPTEASVGFIVDKLRIKEDEAHMFLDAIIKFTRLVLTLKTVTPESIQLLLQEGRKTELSELLCSSFNRCIESWSNSSSTISSLSHVKSFQVDVVNLEEDPQCRIRFHVSSDEKNEDVKCVQVRPEQLTEMIRSMSKIRQRLFATAES